MNVRLGQHHLLDTGVGRAHPRPGRGVQGGRAAHVGVAGSACCAARNRIVCAGARPREVTHGSGEPSVGVWEGGRTSASAPRGSGERIRAQGWGVGLRT